MSRFNKYELRKWSVAVRWRDRKCQVCGSKEKLQAHHIFDKSYHPDKAYDLDNGITLCSSDKVNGHKCHQTFHVMFMGGFRKKCTIDDWIKFLKVIAWVRKHQ